MTAPRIPILPRGVRTHFDQVRRMNVLLGPERALMLDDIGSAVLAEVDGLRSVDQIAARFADRYGAPFDTVCGDVAEFLGGLVDNRLLDMSDG
jgi:pyrroloquinoline quinone biosynthesis protein D